MSGVTHAVLVDESGNGRLLADGTPDPGVRSLWITAGVALEWSKRRTLDTAVKDILRRLFRNRTNELRAANIRRYLPREFTAADVAQEVASAVQQAGAMVWVAGTRAGNAMFSHPRGERAEAKDVARQLLLETISGHAVPRFYAPESWLIVWDVGDAGELADFSHAVATFRNRVSGYPAPPALTPAMLGGLSHEWGGIQVADLYANFALHRFGWEMNLEGAKPDRADAFDSILSPTVNRDNAGKLVGLKFWEKR